MAGILCRPRLTQAGRQEISASHTATHSAGHKQAFIHERSQRQ